jgi:hypothetical protein
MQTLHCNANGSKYIDLCKVGVYLLFTSVVHQEQIIFMPALIMKWSGTQKNRKRRIANITQAVKYNMVLSNPKSELLQSLKSESTAFQHYALSDALLYIPNVLST